MGGCSPEPLGEGCGSLEPASWSRATPGEGCLPVARRPGSRLTAAMPLTLSFLLCLLLAMPAPSRPWARPLWYQVGLDLQPWGCQPEIPEGCRGSLGCLSHWVSLGVNYVYPVALATLAAALVLAIGQLLQRRLRAVAKAEVSGLPSPPPCPPAPCRPSLHLSLPLLVRSSESFSDRGPRWTLETANPDLFRPHRTPQGPSYARCPPAPN